MNDPRLDTIVSRLDALSGQMAYLVEKQKKQEELIDELVLPLAREVMKTATTTLDGLEKDGTLAFGRELLRVGQNVMRHYTAEDVRALGDAITSILDTVRALTQPEVLAVAAEASEVLANADAARPVGMLGLVRATRQEDVGRGIGVMLEVMKRIGRAADVIAKKQAGGDSKRDKVNALLAPRRRALPHGAPQPVRKVTVRPAAAMPAAPTCQVPAKPQATAQVIDGLAFTADGHLVDASAWSRGLAEKLASQLAVPMTDAHWAVIDFARRDFEAQKAAPNIRRITQGTGLQTKDLYTLFPRAPARTVAKIAGLPKPAGCI
jgi:tRNA 2-thiouridine synthesizing protein E